MDNQYITDMLSTGDLSVAGAPEIDRFRELALTSARGASSNFFGNVAPLYECSRRGDLFFGESQSGAWMYEKRDGFFRLYYVLNVSVAYVGSTAVSEPTEPVGSAAAAGRHAPVVVEIPYRKDTVPSAVAYFTERGFRHVLSRSRMCLNTGAAGDASDTSDASEASESGVTSDASESGATSDTGAPGAPCSIIATKVATASGTPNPSDIADTANAASSALTLFSNSFDKYTGCLPSLAELNQASDEGRLVTKTCDGALLGALFPEDTGPVSTLRNIAVSPEARGRGIGGRLVSTWISASRATGKRILRLWVGDDNTTAINLYTKHGFADDGMKSIVLMSE